MQEAFRRADHQRELSSVLSMLCRHPGLRFDNERPLPGAAGTLLGARGSGVHAPAAPTAALQALHATLLPCLPAHSHPHSPPTPPRLAAELGVPSTAPYELPRVIIEELSTEDGDDPMEADAPEPMEE